MHSKKAIWDFRVGIKTYKKFRLPKQMKGTIPPRLRKDLQHHNNKRARNLDWNLVMGFE